MLCCTCRTGCRCCQQAVWSIGMTLCDITKGLFFFNSTPQNAFLGTLLATQEVRRTFSHPCIRVHRQVRSGLVPLPGRWRPKSHWQGGFRLARGPSAPQQSEVTRGYQLIIGHHSSPFRLRSARLLALVVMLMRGIPSPCLHAPCLTFMGLKSSEWWSASVWDSKLHRFNWEESSPWVCWEVPVGWPWAEQHVVHPYKKKKKGKIWLYFPLYDAEINLSAKLAHKSHLPLCKILFYLTLCHISSFYSL